MNRVIFFRMLAAGVIKSLLSKTVSLLQFKSKSFVHPDRWFSQSNFMAVMGVLISCIHCSIYSLYSGALVQLRLSAPAWILYVYLFLCLFWQLHHFRNQIAFRKLSSKVQEPLHLPFTFPVSKAQSYRYNHNPCNKDQHNNG